MTCGVGWTVTNPSASLSLNHNSGSITWAVKNGSISPSRNVFTLTQPLFNGGISKNCFPSQVAHFLLLQTGDNIRTQAYDRIKYGAGL